MYFLALLFDQLFFTIQPLRTITLVFYLKEVKNLLLEKVMTKVGEHITLDIIGANKEYDPSFYEKLVYKIAKLANVTVLKICEPLIIPLFTPFNFSEIELPL